jgi:hypothetical protein
MALEVQTDLLFLHSPAKRCSMFGTGRGLPPLSGYGLKDGTLEVPVSSG